jgi:hypothetical protein
MRTFGICVALVGALVVASFGATMAQTAADPARALASPIGKFVKVTGTVTVERANAAVVQASASSGGGASVKDGDLVYRSDVILTGADGKASLVFADGQFARWSRAEAAAARYPSGVRGRGRFR